MPGCQLQTLVSDQGLSILILQRRSILALVRQPLLNAFAAVQQWRPRLISKIDFGNLLGLAQAGLRPAAELTHNNTLQFKALQIVVPAEAGPSSLVLRRHNQRYVRHHDRRCD